MSPAHTFSDPNPARSDEFAGSSWARLPTRSTLENRYRRLCGCPVFSGLTGRRIRRRHGSYSIVKTLTLGNLPLDDDSSADWSRLVTMTAARTFGSRGEFFNNINNMVWCCTREYGRQCQSAAPQKLDVSGFGCAWLRCWRPPDDEQTRSRRHGGESAGTSGLRHVVQPSANDLSFSSLGNSSAES